MTTGSFSYISSDHALFSQKSWSGGDDPQRKRANNYTMNLYHGVSDIQLCHVFSNPGVIFPVATCTDKSQQNGFLSSDVLDGEVLNMVAESIRGHSFNAAIFAAEGKQSLETVISTLRAVFQAFRSIKRRDLGGALRSLARVPGQSKKKAHQRLEAGDIPGAWLSLIYGWRPLLQDIYEAMNAFEARSNQARGVVVRKRKTTKTPAQDLGWANNPDYARTWTSQSVTVTYKVTFLENLSAARTLGLSNPAAVLWEKLPYSFVVDWALPIGQYLDSLGVFAGLQLSYVKTVFSRATCATLQWRAVQGLGADSPWVGNHGSSTKIKLVRTVGTSLSVPTPSLKTMERIFSVGHLQNASALIAQLVINARK